MALSRISHLLFRTLQYVVLVVLALSILYPLFWVLSGSFKTSAQLQLHPWSLPTRLNFQIYRSVLVNYHLQWNLLNSILITAATVIIVTVLSVLCAYGITRMKWRFSKWTLGFILLGILVPVHATLIPLYTMLQGLQQYIDIRIVLVIPYLAFGLPVSIFIMCGFFRSLPIELEEAAVIDGTSIIGAFFRVILPISRPALATAAIFTFIGAWNELLFALVFLQQSDTQTIPVALLQFIGAYNTNWAYVFAAIVITIVPSIVFYVFLQNKIIEGTTAGAIKL
ncbi:carbohydrate ABC transporter permease [Alicyclobacillus fastidiosus]|uniref:Carbohydrate ABC transporter permease n=1 Tax=Alicyclobacillus fastidiosus TaxID=392011 RepID=A0ABV5AJJ1_9BACL|nr:carbohydrate ABC transporter permease [Alicyclobacillus fastidiosus]WEH08270.1 carbohydrate ABC transporter permease [Alicyclobacillus fastidiosus]